MSWVSREAERGIINEILDISHEHLTVETKNFAGTPRKKGEKIVYQNKLKEKYGIVD